jgi:mannan endo-1,4-beta-mannosidase
MLWHSSVYSTAAAALLLSSQVVARPLDSSGREVPKGFVTTKGTKFQLDGKDFYVAGSNAYYFSFNNVRPYFLN